MLTDTCPQSADLQQLLGSRLPPRRLESIARHLLICRDCVLEMRRLDAVGPFIKCLQSAEAAGALGGDLPQLVRDRFHEPAAPDGKTSQSADIRFPCFACGQKLRIKAQFSGKKVQCPNCNESLTVPALFVSSPAGPSNRSAADQVTSKDARTLGPNEENAELQGLYAFLQPAQGPDEIGRLGPYRVIEFLGVGGMGVVYKAEDPTLQRFVALKAMLPAHAANSAARQRFLREARATAAIRHDHVVTIHQVGEERGVAWLAMELLDGETLEHRLEREPQLPIASAVRIGREIADGLAAAHERGLIHRDIKPANIWLETKRGRVKLLDFGLARPAGENTSLTKLGSVLGTPAYMSPEQAQGHKLDARCDLFSLGCVLYRMVTGRQPFQGSDAVSTLLAVVSTEPVAPEQINLQVEPRLSALINQLLRKKPAERPASATLVADTLEELEKSLTTSAIPVASLLQSAQPQATQSIPTATAIVPPQPQRKNRRVLLAAILVCLFAVVLFVYLRFGMGYLTSHAGVGGSALPMLVYDSIDPNMRVILDRDGKDFATLDSVGPYQGKTPAHAFTARLQGDTRGLQLAETKIVPNANGQSAVRVVAAMNEETPWKLESGGKVSFNYFMLAGHSVKLSATANNDSDINLCVYDDTRLLAVDEWTNRDCSLAFSPLESKAYTVEIVNKAVPSSSYRNVSNSGTLLFTQTKLEAATTGVTILAAKGVVAAREKRSFPLQLNSDRTYTIDLESSALDCYLIVSDATGKYVASDDDGGIGLNSRLLFRPTQSAVYRIDARDLGNTRSGPFTLTVRQQ